MASDTSIDLALTDTRNGGNEDELRSACRMNGWSRGQTGLGWFH